MAAFIRFPVKSLAMLTLLVGGCNLFNPSGDGDGGDSTEAFLVEGENQFREQEFEASMAAFQKAIEQDSTSSLAYYGYAKAVLRHFRLNASTILAEVDDAKASKSIPFLDADNEKLTRYLQATSKVRAAMSQMTRRDTLTRWWRYLSDTNSLAAKKDKRLAQRRVFITGFLAKGNDGEPGYYPGSRFPLSDGALPFEKVVVDYGFVELLYALVHLRDLDQNDTIDSRDNLLTKLNFKMDGGFKLDSLQNIATDLQNDTVARQNINNLIQNVQSGLGSASQVLNLLSPTLTGQAEGDTLSNQNLTSSVTENVDSVINSMGDAIGFYQFGDRLDNDGDGCVDEEILDGKDNDADGFIDEDARVVKGIPDLVDNDHNGKMDVLDPNEDLDGANLLLFTSATGFVQGPLYKNKSFKIRVQQDSLSRKTVFTPGQRSILDSAKSQIGGCWTQY